MVIGSQYVVFIDDHVHFFSRLFVFVFSKEAKGPILLQVRSYSFYVFFF